ncbi:hypothetical protein MHB49_08945 [Paenibacillus sp. FSL K6-0108]
MNQELEKQGAENTYRTPEEVLTAHERTTRIQQVMKSFPNNTEPFCSTRIERVTL